MFKVVVIGCGPNGLTSALAIQEKLKNQASVTIFTKEVSPNTTADIAAGLWTPYLTSESQQEKVTQWSLETYRFLLNLWRNGNAKEFGITFQPIVSVSSKKDYSPPVWAQKTFGYQVLSKKHLDKLSDSMGIEMKNGIIYMGFTWEAAVFLPRLKHEFLLKGGKIVMREISNFGQLNDFDLIVNCTGYSSRLLLNDVKVKPVRGQVTRVVAPWQNYTIMIAYENGGHYIIPNTNCVVLGGTSQYSDDLTTNDEDAKYIEEGCSKCLPSLKNAEVVTRSVGLRPYRDTIRLELDTIDIENRKVPIIHNYGHGGCGITLSIGCSEDVANIAKDVFEQRKCLISKL